ncbi:MAG: hypothetical protein RIR25_141 [Verrucomicrobiota bacterium]
MPTLDTMIVDDEPAARRDLQQVLAAIDGVRVVAQASDAAAARQLARKHRPQLIFMDVQLPGADGFAAIEGIIDERTCVIFTTAYAQFAIRAFEIGAIDYLLKPVDEDRCRRAVERARQQLGKNRAADMVQVVEVEERGAQVRVAADEITLVTAQGNYLELDYRGGRGLVRNTLEGLLAMLAGHLVQINRSQALRLTAVRSYRGNAQSGVLILLANGTEVAVSRRRVAAVTAALRAAGQQRHEGG